MATNKDHRRAQDERLSEALRAYGEGYGQLARIFAATAGVHSTDATALIEILRAEEQGTPLSPARLAEHIGLTSGATSTLLNRLEDAGHIRRQRVATDRRAVTLHSTRSVQATADAFFDPLDERIAQVLSGYTPETISQFATILEQLRDAIETYTEPRNSHDAR